MTQNKIYQKINKHKWIKFLTRPYSPLFISMHMRSYDIDLKEIMQVNFRNYVYLSKNGVVDIYRDKNEYNTVLKKLKNILNNRSSEVDLILKSFAEAKIKLKKAIIEEKNFKNKDINRFENIFNLYSWCFIRLTFLTYFIGNVIEDNFNVQDSYFKKILKNINTLRRINIYEDYEKIIVLPCLNDISNKFNLPKDIIEQMLFEEILQMIQTGKKVSRSELNVRKKRFLYTYFSSDNNITTNQSFISKIESILPITESKKENCVKGIIAQPGKCIGKIKIIYHSQDLKKFKKGDILLSSSTNPKLLPGLKIAGAIVTDEGGITSHAAIIARELKTPCIIGTKIVTQVFKDGDLVEVDADKGIIKKINK